MPKNKPTPDDVIYSITTFSRDSALEIFQAYAAHMEARVKGLEESLKRARLASVMKRTRDSNAKE